MDTRDYEPDAIYTVEGQFIIRFPSDYAEEIRNAIEEDTLNDNLSIDMDINARFATLKWKGVPFYGKMVDLPCIIESNKSIDSKSLYKTGDICQMLVCSLTPYEESRENFASAVPGGWTSRRFLWPHGSKKFLMIVTPPLKNVRTRRFRRIQKKKLTDYSDVEKELRRLIQADISAVSVSITFCVIAIEEVSSELAKKEGKSETPEPT